jgi:hypothetical protein
VRRRLNTIGVLGVVAVISFAAYEASQTRADGIPASQTLTYAGLLTGADGKPLEKVNSILVYFWDKADEGSLLCQTPPSREPPPLHNGRFSVPLLPDCTTAIRKKSDVFVEVVVNGTPLERSKLGAVPYAVEAERASDAAGVLDQRLTALERGGGLPVGSVVSSTLSESQYRDSAGAGWVLADGRAVPKSKYAQITGGENIPDLRGLYLRGKNNGREDGKQNPDGELAIGDFQESMLANHGHSVTDPQHQHDAPTTNGTAGQREVAVNTAGGIDYVDTAGAVRTGPSSTGITIANNSAQVNAGSSMVGNETRPRSATINYFIRID